MPAPDPSFARQFSEREERTVKLHSALQHQVLGFRGRRGGRGMNIGRGGRGRDRRPDVQCIFDVGAGLLSIVGIAGPFVDERSLVESLPGGFVVDE
jgi:hypothetical protein